jgi:hypothetical protein
MNRGVTWATYCIVRQDCQVKPIRQINMPVGSIFIEVLVARQLFRRVPVNFGVGRSRLFVSSVRLSSWARLEKWQAHFNRHDPIFISSDGRIITSDCVQCYLNWCISAREAPLPQVGNHYLLAELSVGE